MTPSGRQSQTDKRVTEMSNTLLLFQVSINRLYAGEKLAPGDRRWRRFTGAFLTENHTAESLLAAVMRGHSFSCVLGECELDHCGQYFCCPNRKDDVTHCGRPFGYRKKSHFISAQTLELDFDQGTETSSIPHLLTDPFISEHAAFLYSTLSPTPQAPKSRVVFVLDTPYTDADNYHEARAALLHRYPQSDQSIKDPARFLYGSDPKTGECNYGW